VLIYMPMVIEGAIAMLACARIGAIHSVVFGGFASKELANRVDDSEPKLIVLASAGIEPGKHISYPPIVDEALSYCERPNSDKIPRLIKQRYELEGKLKADGLCENYHDYDELMKAE
jgi:propionyl-CoA synthetase